MRTNFVYTMLMIAFEAAILVYIIINTWDDTRFFYGAIITTALLSGITINVVFRKKNYPWIKYVNNFVMLFAFLILCEITELFAMMFMLIPLINSFYYRPRFAVLTGVICIIMLHIGLISVIAMEETEGQFFIYLFKNMIASFDITDETTAFLISGRSFLILAGIAMVIVSVYLSVSGRIFTIRQGELMEKNLSTETEMNVARRIQEGILSADFPDNDIFAVYADMTPAEEVGGDFYDYFLIDETRLAVVIGDVSGHGMAAAMFMTLSKTLIKVYAQSNQTTDKVLAQTNSYLQQSNPAKFFVTGWIGILDLTTGVLSYTNAGHNFPVIIRKGGNPEYMRSKPNFVLGRKRLVHYQENQIRLHPGDKLVLYTDGVTEAQSPGDSFFGDDRLLTVLGNVKKSNQKELVAAIRTAIDTFENGKKHQDDATVLALSFKDYLQVEPMESKHFFLTKQTFDEVTEYIEQRCAAEGCNETVRGQITIASSEVLANIDSYAYENGGDVEILTKCRDRVMAVVFRDNGKPFNPLLVEEPDTTLSLKERKRGGLGIFIVKKLMDNVSYSYENAQNVLTIKKEF